MNRSNHAPAVQTRLGVDPWGKSTLEGGAGPLPRNAEFLCTLEVSTILDSVDVDLFVNRPRSGELEIWESFPGLRQKLLSRTMPDCSLNASEQYVEALFEICRCWLGYQGVKGFLSSGLAGEAEWRQLESRLKAEWQRIGPAKTRAIQARLAAQARRR